MSHIPGPWKAIRENPYDDPIEGWCWTVRGPLEGTDETPYFTWIAGCGFEDETNAEANARLMASAPDLLAACEALTQWCDYHAPSGNGLGDVMHRAYEAIAKAKGGAS